MMDFETWAKWTKEIHEHVVRNLGIVVDEDEDDFRSSTISTGNSTKTPLLSPSAEDELLKLATNFLLYVAMVIITTMVAKIYFPESLERGDAAISRRISYRRVTDAELEASYADNNEEEEEEEEGGSGSSEDEPWQRSRQRSRSHSGGSFLEFDMVTSSRATVIKRLLFCSFMLIVTFVAWGALQERMLTRRYPRLTGEYFIYSYALVFSNRFWTLIMSGVMILYFKPRRSQSTILYEYSFPSISNMMSSWCQYEALRYVSFPAQTLFKCFKLVPVMLMGKFLGNKEYPQYDYVVALVIGTGIAMFMTSTDDLRFGYDIHGEESVKWTGIMLLCWFLFFDSFTGQWQSRLFQRHRDLSMIELLFAISAFSTVLSLITLLHDGEFYPAVKFVLSHPEIQIHFFLFSVCSTIGQLVIFYTIKNFGAVVFTIIMTLRVLASIALSCILYGHEVSSTSFLGLCLVMGAVFYRIKRQAEDKQLIKWQGMGDEKAVELVQEWHEHLDM